MNKSRLFLMSAIALMATSCSNDGSKAGNSSSQADSNNVKSEAFETSINIRYVSMDSISVRYVLAQNVAAKAQTLVTELQQYQVQLQNQLQSQANQIQQKAQNNGYLSQASYDADMKELQKKSDNYQRQYAQREQNAAVTMDNLQKELRDSINNFIAAYNAEKKYDAILYRDAGLFFNPALDITEEVIAGLNARFTGKAEGNGSAAPVQLGGSNSGSSLGTSNSGGLQAPATLPGIGK